MVIVGLVQPPHDRFGRGAAETAARWTTLLCLADEAGDMLPSLQASARTGSGCISTHRPSGKHGKLVRTIASRLHFAIMSWPHARIAIATFCLTLFALGFLPS